MTHTILPVPSHLQKFFELFDSMTMAFWKPSEVDHSADRVAFEKLHPSVRHMVLEILPGFVCIDDIVGVSWSDILPANIINNKVIDACVKSIVNMEVIHEIVYNRSAIEFIQDPKERDSIFNNYKETKVVQDIINFTNKYVRPTSLDERKISHTGDLDVTDQYEWALASHLFIEQVFLPVNFAFISWMEEGSASDIFKKRIPGFCQANRFIVQDEAVHATFGRMILTQWKETIPPYELYKERAEEFLKVTDDFIDVVLGDGVPGLNANTFKKLARTKINDLFIELYPDNPLPYKQGNLSALLVANNSIRKESSFETVASVYSGVVWDLENLDDLEEH